MTHRVGIPRHRRTVERSQKMMSRKTYEEHLQSILGSVGVCTGPGNYDRGSCEEHLTIHVKIFLYKVLLLGY